MCLCFMCLQKIEDLTRIALPKRGVIMSVWLCGRCREFMKTKEEDELLLVFKYCRDKRFAAYKQKINRVMYN